MHVYITCYTYVYITKTINRTFAIKRFLGGADFRI